MSVSSVKHQRLVNTLILVFIAMLLVIIFAMLNRLRQLEAGPVYIDQKAMQAKLVSCQKLPSWPVHHQQDLVQRGQVMDDCMEAFDKYRRSMELPFPCSGLIDPDASPPPFRCQGERHYASP